MPRMTISFDRVTKEYPGGVVAVDDFSLEIPTGSLTVLLGSSGSGKTTLLRMVNRMVEPTRGRVLIDGNDIKNQDPTKLRRSIGYVLQAGGLLPHRTVVDNVATVLKLNGVDKREARHTAREWIARVGLDADVANRYPAELSGGQQQRVGVARALAADPQILLMDEPFGAVDPIVRTELQDELSRLHHELGKTVVFVTHDIDEAFRLGDEVVLLQEHAHIAQRGTPEQILAAPASKFVRDFIGSDVRTMTMAEHGGRLVVFDGSGQAVGVISDDDDAAAPAMASGGPLVATDETGQRHASAGSGASPGGDGPDSPGAVVGGAPDLPAAGVPGIQ